MSNPEHDQRGGARPYGSPGPYGPGPASLSGPPPGLPQGYPGGGQGYQGGGQGYPGTARHPRREQDPTRPVSPGFSGAALRSAGLAVAAVAVVLFLSSLLSFLGNITYQGATEADSTGYVPLRAFFDDWFFSPFPFYVGAAATLAFLTPIIRRSPLPVILLRAVLGGAGGTVLLMVVGVFTGFTKAVQQDDWTWTLTDIVTGPLAQGIRCTAVLVAAAVATWLWLGRPGAARRFGTPGMPGTIRPADALPPATVVREAPRQYATPVWGPPLGTGTSPQPPTGGPQPPASRPAPAAWPGGFSPPPPRPPGDDVDPRER